MLRRKPFGTLLKSAHAIEREYRVQDALKGTGVPLARMIHLCDDTEVIGAAFYVMEHVEGRIFWDPALAEIDPSERRAYYEAWPARWQLSTASIRTRSASAISAGRAIISSADSSLDNAISRQRNREAPRYRSYHHLAERDAFAGG